MEPTPGLKHVEKMRLQHDSTAHTAHTAHSVRCIVVHCITWHCTVDRIGLDDQYRALRE